MYAAPPRSCHLNRRQPLSAAEHKTTCSSTKPTPNNPFSRPKILQSSLPTTASHGVATGHLGGDLEPREVAAPTVDVLHGTCGSRLAGKLNLSGRLIFWALRPICDRLRPTNSSRQLGICKILAPWLIRCVAPLIALPTQVRLAGRAKGGTACMVGDLCGRGHPQK
jgi:hypothetical protein